MSWDIDDENLEIFTHGEFSTLALVHSATSLLSELSGIFDENYHDMFGDFGEVSVEGRNFCFEVQSKAASGLLHDDFLTIKGKNYSIVSFHPLHDGKITKIILKSSVYDLPVIETAAVEPTLETPVEPTVETPVEPTVETPVIQYQESYFDEELGLTLSTEVISEVYGVSSPTAPFGVLYSHGIPMNNENSPLSGNGIVITRVELTTGNTYRFRKVLMHHYDDGGGDKTFVGEFPINQLNNKYGSLENSKLLIPPNRRYVFSTIYTGDYDVHLRYPILKAFYRLVIT